jgi:hypothetical protein
MGYEVKQVWGRRKMCTEFDSESLKGRETWDP